MSMTPDRDEQRFSRGIVLFTDHALVAKVKRVRRQLGVGVTVQFERAA